MCGCAPLSHCITLNANEPSVWLNRHYCEAVSSVKIAVHVLVCGSHDLGRRVSSMLLMRAWFLFVYIIQTDFAVKQHRNLEERVQAAQLMLNASNLQAPVLVDSTENEANLAYGALPIRLCIILNGRVVFTGGIGPTFYKTAEVRRWLERWQKSEINVWSPRSV